MRHYLLQTPRQLPSRALYDTLGSTLFDAICELPWYPLTRAERRVLTTNADNILTAAGMPSRLVELGCGNGSKLDLLLSSIESRSPVQQIDLIDVSRSALSDAERRLTEGRAVRVVTHAMAYEQGLRELTGHASVGPTLLLFLGSNIGNFDPSGAETFLRQMRRAVASGDTLLLGADLVKPESDLLLAYDDPLGVTAAFNKNLLLHLNRELGASFDVRGFDHRAVWNAPASRIEMHLVSRAAQHIAVPAAGLSIDLQAGEAIWTESSYKYRTEDVWRMLDEAGFAVTRQWQDEPGRFLLALAKAV